MKAPRATKATATATPYDLTLLSTSSRRRDIAYIILMWKAPPFCESGPKRVFRLWFPRGNKEEIAPDVLKTAKLGREKSRLSAAREEMVGIFDAFCGILTESRNNERAGNTPCAGVVGGEVGGWGGGGAGGAVGGMRGVGAGGRGMGWGSWVGAGGVEAAYGWEVGLGRRGGVARVGGWGGQSLEWWGVGVGARVWGWGSSSALFPRLRF